MLEYPEPLMSQGQNWWCWGWCSLAHTLDIRKLFGDVRPQFTADWIPRLLPESPPSHLSWSQGQAILRGLATKNLQCPMGTMDSGSQELPSETWRSPAWRTRWSATQSVQPERFFSWNAAKSRTRTPSLRIYHRCNRCTIKSEGKTNLNLPCEVRRTY